MENGMKPTLEWQIVQANKIFANNLYQILAQKEGNIIFSPICVHAALSMLYQGAQGDTAYSLSYTLKNRSAKSTAEGYKSVMEHLNSIDEVTLLMANKIYGGKNKTQFRKEFENRILKNFASEVDVLNFEKYKAAAGNINKWAEKKTKKNISNMIDSKLLKNNMGLIVTSVIYFNGEWISRFKKSSTKSGKFFLNKRNSVKVQMMYQKEKLLYKHDDELMAQIVEVPYKNYNVKMMIVLPFENSSVKDLEEKLIEADLARIRRNLQMKDVHLHLPKFKLEETIQLRDVLIEMGLRNIFDEDQANFRTMADKDNGLFVTDIIQKVKIKVNEKGGTKKSPTDKHNKSPKSTPGMLQTVTYKVDRPAIFLLLASHDDITNVILYGRLSRPVY